MIETVLAVLVITFVFVILYRLSFMLTGKILVEHAAMRVARARSVGMNRFMCLKAARVATLPVAGKRIWPGGDTFDTAMELARVPIYMCTEDEPVARGVLEYEGWKHLSVDAGDGTDASVKLGVTLFGEYDCEDSETVQLEGAAGIEPNATLYMNDQGR